MSYIVSSLVLISNLIIRNRIFRVEISMITCELRIAKKTKISNLNYMSFFPHNIRMKLVSNDMYEVPIEILNILVPAVLLS